MNAAFHFNLEEAELVKLFRRLSSSDRLAALTALRGRAARSGGSDPDGDAVAGAIRAVNELLPAFTPASLWRLRAELRALREKQGGHDEDARRFSPAEAGQLIAQGVRGTPHRRRG